MQVYGVLFLPYAIFQLPDPSHGWHEDSRMYGSILWQCALHKSGSVYPGHHVRYGPDLVLLGHIPMVHHLEHHLFHLPVIHAWPVDLDSLEGYLCEVAEEDLHEAAGITGHGG